MKTNEISLSNENIIINKSAKETEKQKKLISRQRLEDYFDEKKLRENISDFDFSQ